MSNQLDNGPCMQCGTVNSHSARSCFKCGSALPWVQPHLNQNRPPTPTRSYQPQVEQPQQTPQSSSEEPNDGMVVGGLISSGIGILGTYVGFTTPGWLWIAKPSFLPLVMGIGLLYMGLTGKEL